MAKFPGTSVVLEIADNTSPFQYQLVAGQQEGRFVGNSGRADITDKSQQGWGSFLQVTNRATVDISGVIENDDIAGLGAIRRAFRTRGPLRVRLTRNDTGDFYEGPFTTSNYRESGRYDGAGEYSFSLENVGPVTTSVYTANATFMNGINDYIHLDSSLGGQDSNHLLLSFWFRPTEPTSPGDDEYILHAKGSESPTSEHFIRWDPATSQMFFNFDRAGSIVAANLVTVGGVALDRWHHILMAYNGDVPITQFFINNNPANLFEFDSWSAPVEWDSVDDLHIGSTTDGDLLYRGCMAEFYLATAQYLDISKSVNQRKFVTTGGTPVHLGADGSAPTGRQPEIYLRSSGTAWHVNAGTAGNLIEAASLENCIDTPALP
jgi:predicted secreted protein